jgi:cation diffusion facilitator CzcD-associated flavoprotein CzcO
MANASQQPPVSSGEPDADALIIGAGFSGLYMLHRLRDDLGLRCRVLEASDDVGGTWNWTRYPGARCDSDSFAYCYSFDADLLQEWQWKGKYPEQAEILSYLQHVADRFDLRGDIAFNTRVQSAHFDDENALWTVGIGDGRHLRARYLITGIGQLAIARYVPSIPGIDDFAGSWYHTGAWPRDGVDVRGKRVGVIGTGSSGVQSIPVIAKEADHLTVFQRTPQYTIPARHETVDEQFWVDTKARYGEIFEQAAASATGFPYQHNGKNAFDVTDEERAAIYESAWAQGGMRFALSTFRDVAFDMEANQTMSDFIRDKIRARVTNPQIRERLVPTHPFLSRRPIVDTDYFETYNRPNVTLVDVASAPITEITKHGISTTDGNHALDVIVFATGFDAVTGPFFNIDIRGRHGVPLTDHWNAGPRSYLGVMTAGFPNLFMVTGPGSTIGNLPLTIETHVDWITSCIEFMRREGITTIETTPERENEWTAHVNREAEKSVISHADSWYNGANIPGKARAYVFYFGHFGRYRSQLKQLAEAGFTDFVLDQHQAPASSNV